MVSGTCAPSYSYVSPVTFSTYRSATSGPRLVNPQAMRSLWPMITPGSPEKLKPATSNGHCASTTAQCRPTWYQTEGITTPRCGSLASSGFPVAVWAPETTQEFDPMSSPAGPIRVGRASRLEATCSSRFLYWAVGTAASAAVASASPAAAEADAAEPPGAASGVTVVGEPPPSDVIVGCAL